MDGRMTQRTVNAFGQSRQYFAGAALNNLRCAFQNQPAHAFDPAHRDGHLPRKRVADFRRRVWDRYALTRSAAGLSNEECKGADTGNGTARCAPALNASLHTVSTGLRWPAMTVCVGALKFTASTVPSALTAVHSARTL